MELVLTPAEERALAAGLARFHKGRLIPVMRGGDDGGDAGAAAGDAGAGSGGDAGTGGDGGQAGAAADAGAAATGATGAQATGDQAAPPPSGFNFDEWSETPEGQAKLGTAFGTWAQQQAAAQQAADEAAAAAVEDPFSDIKDAFGLLGIEPDRLDAFLQAKNAPFAQVAQKVQEQEALQWVDSQLGQLGTSHPDLLGAGIDALAEIVGDDGQPLFNPSEVRDANRNAVLFAAAGLQNAHNLDHGQALEQGAKVVAERDALMMKVGVERYKQQLSQAGNAPRDPASGAAAGTDSAPRYTDERDFARAFAGRRG